MNRDAILKVAKELREQAVAWNNDIYSEYADELEAACRCDTEPVTFGWLIENGKQAGDGLAYRFMDNGNGGVAGWTTDHNKALRFARREDAEQFAHHDEDAWRIAEHGWHGATPSIPEGWQPIETAPNKVPIIVLYDNDSVEFYDAESNTFRWGTRDEYAAAHRACPGMRIKTPISWMPLPSAPKEAKS